MAIVLDGTNGITSPNETVTGQFSSGSTFGFKNRIINGGMGIWQRGTSGFTTNGNYSADRWIVAGTLSAVAQSTDVPNSSFKYSITNTGSANQWVGQRIESNNCTDLVGQSITVSFWLKQTLGAGSNALQLGLFNTATQDNWATPVNFSNTAFTTTSAWAYYSFTINTLPTNCTNGIELIVQSTISGSSTFYITGVQLEKGSVATSFDQRAYSQELAMCQRYYQASRRYHAGCTTSSQDMTWLLPILMRASPTLTVVDIVGNANKLTTSSGNNIAFNAGGVSATTDSVVIQSNTISIYVWYEFYTPLNAEL